MAIHGPLNRKLPPPIPTPVSPLRLLNAPRSIRIGKVLKVFQCQLLFSVDEECRTYLWFTNPSIGITGFTSGRLWLPKRLRRRKGALGNLRRDPMAMLPFCGYNMGDYFRHWIKMGKKLREKPRIFHVNWFRKDAEGKFLWPGFGENMRVLRWIVERSSGRGRSHEDCLGWVPRKEDLDWSGLDFSDEQWDELMSVDPQKLRMQALRHEELFLELSEFLPKEMLFERELLVSRL